MTTTHPKRLVRFGIRSILLVTGWLAVFLGYRTNIARREQPALQLVREHGGSPLYRHDIFGNLPSFAPGIVRDVIGVENFGSAVRLNFQDGHPTQDEAFSKLDLLPNVTVINTDGSLLTDDGIAPVRHLSRLTTLRLNHAKNITDEGLQHIRELDELHLLDLSGTSVTDQGLSELRDLGQLEFLILGDTQVTDCGIMELRQMKALKLLKLRGTSVTPRGVELLQKQLPNCEITFDQRQL